MNLRGQRLDTSPFSTHPVCEQTHKQCGQKLFLQKEEENHYQWGWRATLHYRDIDLLQKQFSSVLGDVSGITRFVLNIKEGYSLHIEGRYHLDRRKGISTRPSYPKTLWHASLEEKLVGFPIRISGLKPAYQGTGSFPWTVFKIGILTSKKKNP